MTADAPVAGRRRPGDLERLHDVPVELAVEIGRTRMTIGETLALGPGSIITLNRLAGEPVDLLVNGKPIARGEVVVIDEEFGLRVTEVVTGGRAGRTWTDASPALRPRVAPSGAGCRARHSARMLRALARFWRKAYEDNLTGMAAMVAYNLMLSVFPLALVGVVRRGPRPLVRGRRGVGGARPRAPVPGRDRVDAARRAAARARVLDHRRDRGARGRGLVLGLVLGRAGHGVLPDLPPRVPLVGAPEGVRPGNAAVVLLFFVASVTIPTLQGFVVRGRGPAARARRGARPGLRRSRSPAAWCCCSRSCASSTGACRAGRSRGAAIWPGAAGALVAMGVVDYAFPLYLANVTSLRIGTSFVFVLIVLVWFYVLALILLAGAVVNELRFEARRPPQDALTRPMNQG